jgi:hypothetical protein
MRIMRLHLHDGPMWASPKVSAYLHVGSTDYFGQYMLHYVSPPHSSIKITPSLAAP